MKLYVGILLFMLQGGLLNAQNPATDSLRQSFRNFQLGTPQEKLFIHTDKTFYLAGETIWFKVYVVDAASHKPMDVSSISFVEVINKELKSVLKAKVSMKAGCGNGFLVIPGFLNSGNYILRGYTNWMKNFPAEFYFEQPITIVNTLKRLTASLSNRQNAAIQFFPEGGSWLNGFSAKLAFKAIDRNGVGLDIRGVIVNQHNDTIVAFQSVHNGMGSFQFMPEKESEYFAVVRLEDSIIKQKLPATEVRGYCMSLASNESDNLKILVHATSDYENTTIYLFAQTRLVAKSIQAGEIRNGEALFKLNKKDLGDGISTLTIFDGERRPVCERLVFKKPEKQLSITATSDQAVYEKRTPVNINLLAESNSHAMVSNLSASVFMIDSLQKKPEQDILSYLYLASDLKGNIESPDYYFASADKSTDEAVDILLLTQGWRRFKWDDVLSNKKPVFEFIPEMEGPVVNGRIIDKYTGEGVGGVNAFVGVSGADYAFNISTSGNKGLIHFAFRNIYNNNALIVQPVFAGDSNNRIEIMNNWSEKYSITQIRSLTLSKNEQRELLNRSIDNQIENTYAIEKKRLYPALHQDTSSFFGQADKVYYLDEYTRYQTMEEVLREFVIDVRVRKEGDKFSLRVKNDQTSLYFDGLPLILLDGIPIEDGTKIVALDPLKIKKIELIAHTYYIGSFSFDGVINITSYSKEIGATLIDRNAMVVDYEGIQMQREFYEPSYSTVAERQSRLPDYRNVLYWAPEVKTGKDGKAQLSFYTSDVAGKFLIFIQGITSEGIPGKSIMQIEVKNSN